MKTKGLALLLSALLAAAPTACAETNITLSLQPLFQEDYDGLSFAYKGTERTVASSGCAAVCLSMALSVLRPDVEQTPETIFLQAHNMGGYHGGGFSVEQIRALALQYDVELIQILGRSAAVREALLEGGPVLVATADGKVFHNAHYVLIYGVDTGNVFHVADPGDTKEIAYPWDTMFPDDQKGDLFYAFRSVHELENMGRRVNVLVQDNLKRVRDAK